MKYLVLILPLIFVSCSTSMTQESLSKKELIEKNTKLLNNIRPLLKSDDLPYMECRTLGRVGVKSKEKQNTTLWQKIGGLKLRELSLEKEANIMAIESEQYATIYNCKEKSIVSEVDIAGMCKPSEERIFTLDYDPEEIREMGKVVLKTIVRYYALENYYKTFHLRDIKYSYTKKQFSGKAYFFKCQ